MNPPHSFKYKQITIIYENKGGILGATMLYYLKTFIFLISNK